MEYILNFGSRTGLTLKDLNAINIDPKSLNTIETSIVDGQNFTV